MTTATDLETGLSVQGSFTHHGDRDSVERYRTGLIEKRRTSRCSRCGMPVPITVQELLDAFLSAPHRWSATT